MTRAAAGYVWFNSTASYYNSSCELGKVVSDSAVAGNYKWLGVTSSKYKWLQVSAARGKDLGT